MSPPHRQSVAQISAELGIHVVIFYNCRNVWRSQGEVVPASEKEAAGWSAADQFTVVLETAGLNATELSDYCRERDRELCPEQVKHWRQTAQDAMRSQCSPLKSRNALRSSLHKTSERSRLSRKSCSAGRKPWLRWRPCWC